jgi:uncharacterized protein involved in response to NO
VWASLAAALIPGFGAGTVLFLALWRGWPLDGGWWPAMAQGHGYAQLFGFAGLLVFGVALHFLPRLRGAPLAWQRAQPWLLALYGGGVLLRAIAQLTAPIATAGGASGVLRAAFAASGPLTLAGASLGIAMLAATARTGPPLRTRPGLVQVLPLLVASWVAWWLALALDAWGTLRAGMEGALLVAPAIDQVVVRIAFFGWLVPVAAAFTARNFPLFARTRAAPSTGLREALFLLLAGLAIDVATRVTAAPPAAATALAQTFEALGLLWIVAAAGIFGPRTRPLGRNQQRVPEEALLAGASEWALVGAYAWLAVAAVLLLAGAAAALLSWPPPPADVVRHALGAGFILVLIVGMALRLLPGFAGGARKTVDLPAARVAIGAAHTAAALRVLPVVVAWGSTMGGSPAPSWLTACLTLAGVAGLVSVAALAVALRRPLAP